MANIQQYLDAISQAIYGEEVRGSIHDAIDIINKVSEKTIVEGTDVTSENSPTTGYYNKSLYLNTNTWDLWECTGSAWTKLGNLKGQNGRSVGSIVATGNTQDDPVTGAHGVEYAIKDTDNVTINTIYIYDGKPGNKIGIGNEVTSANTSTTLSGVTYYLNDIYINNSTWYMWKCLGNTNGWQNVGYIRGQDGSGAGDMLTSVYDKNNDHKIDMDAMPFDGMATSSDISAIISGRSSS